MWNNFPDLVANQTSVSVPSQTSTVLKALANHSTQITSLVSTVASTVTEAVTTAIPQITTRMSTEQVPHHHQQPERGYPETGQNYRVHHYDNQQRMVDPFTYTYQTFVSSKMDTVLLYWIAIVALVLLAQSVWQLSRYLKEKRRQTEIKNTQSNMLGGHLWSGREEQGRRMK